MANLPGAQNRSRHISWRNCVGLSKTIGHSPVPPMYRVLTALLLLSTTRARVFQTTHVMIPLRSLCSCTFAFVLTVVASFAAEPSKPNVLIVLVDDAGY